MDSKNWHLPVFGKRLAGTREVARTASAARRAGRTEASDLADLQVSQGDLNHPPDVDLVSPSGSTGPSRRAPYTGP
jgi:hypothetical protein